MDIHEILSERKDFDLVVKEINSIENSHITSLYHTLNNYGFLVILFKKEWDKISELIVNADRVEKSSRQEKDKETYYDGLKFYELYVRKENRVLVLRKVKANKRKVSCPVCLSDQNLRVNGYDSYSVVSWECANDSCTRSKTGRGKRFSEDFLIAQHASKMPQAQIPDHLLKRWRRDVEDLKKPIKEILLLIKYRYSYPWSKVSVLESSPLKEIPHKKKRTLKSFEQALTDPKSIRKTENLVMLNGDSSNINYNSFLKEIDTVFTSPPYFNAREYSTYDSVYHYLTVMRDVFLNIKNQSNIKKYYVNIADVVCQDPTFFSASSVKKRVPISLLLVEYLRDIGLFLNKVYVWDKGEPQSKKHMNPNKTAVYSKPLNAFEFVFLFLTEETEETDTSIFKLSPVIKINNKKINLAKHTAPFPIALLDIVLRNENTKGVLDPFLGSGTSGVWCKEKDLNFVGVERDEEYFKLSVKRISEAQKMLF